MSRLPESSLKQIRARAVACAVRPTDRSNSPTRSESVGGVTLKWATPEVGLAPPAEAW